MATVSKGNRTFQPERFCKYIHRYCNQTRLEGYDYCIRHILEDKTAPFKQCIYVNQPNRKRCTNAAPKSEKNERRDNVLCPFHAKRAMLKVKIATPRRKPVEGPATFLKSLEHYCKNPYHDPSHKRETATHDRNEVPICEGGGGPTSLSDLESNFNESDSIDAKARIESIDDDFCWVEKYGESLDNAGVYTYKEILTIAKEKILRLQHLYCQELKVVYRQLRENRRQFLVEINNLNHSKVSETTQQIAGQLEKNSLQALMQHHRRSGTERVFRHRVQMKRMKSSDKPAETKEMCTYEKRGIKCQKDALVLTKFCKSHILSDPKQLLFKPCPLGQKIKCRRPVLIFEEDSSCDFHLHRLLKSKLNKPIKTSPSPELDSKSFQLEPEPFQSMDDIASLGLDAITPGSLFGLDQYGEPGESTDTVLSEDQADLMQIQPISAIPPADILSDSRKSEFD